MTAQPRVTIVLRTRNRPYFLERAVRDILAQRFSDWHLVVSNDGGDPRQVGEVLAPFGDALADRVTVIDVEAPNGRCAAANQAIRAAASDYVVLHDDDDRWDPDFLATTTEWLDTHPGDGMAVVATEIVYERAHGAGFREVRREPFWPGMTQITYLDLLQINRAVPIAVLYRRSLHESVGFYDETLDAVEDWEFYLRVALDHGIGVVPGRPLAFWSQRPATRGDQGNSMFALGDIHERFDTIVRDRALRAFARQYGPGLPLFIAGLAESQFERQRRLMLGRSPWRALARRILRRR